MYWKICLWFISLCFLSPLLAEEKNCLLWKAQGDMNTVYLLGSMHMMKMEDYPLDRCIDKAFDEAEQLVVELDISTIDANQMALKMRKLSLLPVGQQLSEQLSAETGRLLAQHSSLPAGYQQLQTWYLSLILVLTRTAELGYRADLGVDQYLINKAQGVKKISSLETLDQQLAVLAGDSKKEQDLTLRLTLTDLNNMGNDIASMSNAWRSGDAESIYNMMQHPLHTYPQLREQFNRQVVERNVNMAQKIRELFKEKDDYIVVVGGGHLGGDVGILQLLKQQGIKWVQQPQLGSNFTPPKNTLNK